MAKISVEGIEEVFKVWNEVVVHHEPPQPLGYAKLRERLGLPIDRNKQITAKSLMDVAETVLALPPETEDLPLMEASYYWLVKQHTPWALKK